MKKLCFLFFLICGISFSQNLEEAIYTAAESFISNKNENSFQLLKKQEALFKTQAKTKDEQLALVFLQCHKAYYLDEHSKLKDAISSYEDALNRFKNNELSKLSNFDIIESCLKPLGNLYTKTGDYTNAVSTINQYIFLAEKSKNTKHQISGAINLAKLYQTIGKHETVLKIVDDAFKLSNSSTNQKTLLQSIKASSLIALNKYNEAALLNNSTSKFENFKNNYIVDFQKNNYENALTSLKKAKECLSEANLSTRELAKFYVEEAQLQFILKNQNVALKSLQKAIKLLIPDFKSNGLPTKNDLYAENTFIDIFDLYATIETNSKNALECYNLSFHVSELLQENWTSQENKTRNQSDNRIRSEKCIDIVYYNYQKTKNKALLFEAFQFSETNKASILKSINQKKKRLQQHPNDPLLVKEFSLIKAQEHYTNLLIKEQLGNNQASKLNALSEQLTSISLQLKSLKPNIEKKYPENKNFYTLETIQKKLKKDKAVLVEYFYGKNSVYQFIISEKDMTLQRFELSNETKQNIINFIHLFDDGSIINNNINNYTNQAFSIYNLLKLNTISPYKNVVIIPDGLLNFIPFEALLSSKTRTTSFEKMPFLIKNQTIVYNSNAQFYLTEHVTNNNNQLLGFFPVFENTNQKLTYSIDEAQAIEENIPSKIFMNAEASKKNFIKNASKYGILHLSTHASAGNSVTPANLSFYDDTMFLNELYSLDINPNLVVLSACETGIGVLYKGEGAMSMARGFQYAGTENLLFTLWQINDLSTSQIMQSFYKNYSDSQSAFFANHQSKIDYLENKSISNAKKSPYYWSSFVYYGKLEPPKSNYTLFYIIFSIAISLIVLFLFLKHRKHDRNTSRISSK
ncbi:CHAT domain-containing protein [Mariniflexile fucanivorans]|uniref:CHAT domain-containing protein n=1 Tax=Mariniflexile fucanivorans TaxID=264023 RepID=A0A4R1RRA3_9FLAO|nr:CHAT domain-containing protein [Mariniflexile fucanivorans]TCL68953.1 CHAT domain-containing protein [Mariniflexile fucanivorans]